MPPYTPQLLPLKSLNWEQFVHLIGKANAEVARFDGILQSIPNPNVLVSPLLTNEAVLSSRIEGTQATFQEVLEYEANPAGDSERSRDIIEVLNYRKALNYATEDINKISLSNRLIRNIHSRLLDSVRGKSKDPGNFRRLQVHVGSYFPPEPQNVPDLMSNLESYIHKEDKDILVQLAIIHAQFEIIHPFWDGNGRTGRIIMPLFLYFKKVLTSPAFYLSAYFEANRNEYYHKFEDIEKNGDWEGWIEFFLRAVIEQSKINIQKAQGILKLYDIKKERITSLTHSQFSIRALDYIFSYPIFTSTDFIEKTKIPRQSAHKILRLLVAGEVLEIFIEGQGQRPNAYVFSKLMEIVG